jgi:hypothetical protein
MGRRNREDVTLARPGGPLAGAMRDINRAGKERVLGRTDVSGREPDDPDD